MSFSTLHVGASGLYAAQRASEVAGHNVANASTPGFTKQRLSVTSAPPNAGQPGLRGNGVVLVSIDRVRDLLADLSYRGDAANAGASAARADVLSRAEGVLGTYPEGATAALDRFFSSWDQLSLTPQEPAARANVLDSGKQLASSLGAAVARLAQLSDDMGSLIDDRVREVNGLARHVAGLNLAIAEAVTGGQSPNDLFDQRDVALDRLATLTGSTVDKSTSGKVDVYIGNSLLVSGVDTQELRTVKTGDAWTVLFPDGTSGVSGEVGAYARSISIELPEFARQIDDVAVQLATRINAVHREAHSLLPHGPEPDGGDFFVGDSAATLRVRPDLSEQGIAVSATGAPTDGNAALGVSALRDGSPSLGDLLRGVGSRLGAAVANSARERSAMEAALSGAEQRRSAANGVNIDEEMVDLVKFQHAYQAAARVVSMADEFYDTIINRMGAGR